MVPLTPAQRLARLTADNVKHKPKDLNMLDNSKRHIFKAHWMQDLKGLTTELAEGLKKHPEIKPRHEVIVVGKGEVCNDEQVFAGRTWSIIQGGEKTSVWSDDFDTIPRLSETKYIGWTTKSDDEIDSIAKKWQEEHALFSIHNHCQTFALHLLSEINEGPPEIEDALPEIKDT
ncbi:hypothetical protein MMC17_002317 [Xylographa soralifera]|nr:hypothetical protein [Xylographa soralifera]